MGMSVHVVAFKPADEKWHKMKAAWDACATAGIDPPAEVQEFFGWSPPDPAGVEVDEDAPRKTGAVTDWSDEMVEGFEVDVRKLPPDVAVIRFFNSY